MAWGRNDAERIPTIPDITLTGWAHAAQGWRGGLMQTHSFSPSLHLSAHKAAQPNANFSASVSPLSRRAHTNAHGLPHPSSHTCNDCGSSCRNGSRAIVFFLLPYLFFLLNEETVELIIRERPLTQFPGSGLASCSAVAKAHKGRKKCLLIIRV